MVPVLRLLSILTLFAGLVSFLLLPVFIDKDNISPAGLGFIFFTFFLVVAGMCWMTYSLKREEKDGRLRVAWDGWMQSLKAFCAKISSGILAFFRPVFRVLFGDRGPDDVVITHDETGASFHLPHRWHSFAKTGPWMIVLLIGPILLSLTIVKTVALPPQQRDLQGMMIGVTMMIALMGIVLYKARIVWHDEIRMTQTTLHSCRYATFWHWNRPLIELGLIEQFTVVRCQNFFVLQAEGKEGPPFILLSDRDNELLVRIAVRFADERRRFNATSPKVAVESALQGV